MNTLATKSALITGGSRGIGRAVALALAAEGADVAITYSRSAHEAESLVSEVKALGRRAFAIKADSADAAAVRSSVHVAAEQLGRLDILVNNAGVLHAGGLTDISLEDIESTLDVNVKAVVVASQAALKYLPNGGRIINIGSCLALRVPLPGLSVYAMSKSALIAFTQGLAREVGARGITVNIVHPGPTDTEMNPADGEAAESQRASIALEHYGTSEDVAGAVLFLAGPAGKQISGTGLSVDGGINA